MTRPIASLQLLRPARWFRLLAFALLCNLWISVLLPAGNVQSAPLWQEDEQRFTVGLKLFPAFLGGVQWNKDNVPAKRLLVLVVYEDTSSVAQEAVNRLAAIKEIRGRTLKVELVSASDLPNYSGSKPQAIFVASTGIDGARLRHWSERFAALVFSPFSGDVRNGAVAGIFVSDKILPLVNMTQAQKAGIHFKPFFLLVAKQYD